MGNRGSPNCCRRCENVDVDWIRLMYFYPMYIDQPLIETIASSSRILPYIDLPLQHINDRMLRRMARRVTRNETRTLLRSSAQPDSRN